MQIKTFGDVDDRSLQQLRRCMEAGDAEFGVLCADHHPGYSQPIGGAVAYEGYVSPSGVGFDIGCLAGGTRVTLDDGSSLPIERFDGSVAPRCWDGRSVRAVDHATSLATRGTRGTVRLTLANDRVLDATGDHLIRTKIGWREASLLRPGDRIACSPFVGLRREHVTGEVPIDDIREPIGARKLKGRRAELAQRNLWPLQLADPRLPALLRLLGFVSGDGHLAGDGKSATFYTFCDEDAVGVVRDVQLLGFEPRIHARRKAPHLEPEIAVRVNSVGLVALFSAMGSPVGKKRWTDSPMPWLFELPAWLRSQFVSGFASADMSGPSLVDGRLVNIALKQVSFDSNAPLFFARLLATLGFRTGISWRPSANGRTAYVLQLLGGESEQLRFLEEIGYCHSYARRVAAAATSSVAWQRHAVVERRRRAHAAARELKAQGSHRRSIVELVTQEFGVSTSFVHHSMYGRGAPRSPKGLRFEPDYSGEIAWVAVRSVCLGDVVDVFDVVTSDPAESFLAEGVVVHNCGNKAARTDLTRTDLDALGGVERIMGEITRRISFGMGVAAQERVDHPVLERIRTADFAPQRKLANLAESQLGTVGSGNHYVNLMEDADGRIWVGVHFGSRGFGHKTASGFLALAQGLRFGDRAHEGDMDSPPVLFEIDSELGQSYISAMELAGEYAYAGRDTVVSKVLEILGAKATDEVHNHHNYAFLEEHFGRTFWVIRKGCTPARPGQEGFVGATMGDDSVILEGVEGPGAAESLYSTVHGAGRVMSRTQAAGKVRRRRGWACRNRDCDRIFDRKRDCPDHPGAGVRKVSVEEQLKPGVVDWPAVQARLRAQGIVLVGGGADEAPEVYKRLPDVLAAHAGSIRVKHALRPLGVAMAGRDVHDPYRD